MMRLAQDMLRKIVHATIMIALLTGIASAQMPSINLAPVDRELTPEEKEKQKAIDNAYKSAIGKIPDKQKPVDPWGNIRANPPSSGKTKQGQQ